MFYVKDKEGTPIYLPDAPVFSSCPVCGKEHSFDALWEFLSDDESFDMFSSPWCDACSVVLQYMRDKGMLK